MTKQQAMIYVAFMVGVSFGAWFVVFMKWLMRDKPDNNCVECGGGPCRVWRGNAVAGSAGLSQMQDSRDCVTSAGTSDIRCKCVSYEAGGSTVTDSNNCPMHHNPHAEAK